MEATKITSTTLRAWLENKFHSFFLKEGRIMECFSKNERETGKAVFLRVSNKDSKEKSMARAMQTS